MDILIRKRVNASDAPRLCSGSSKSSSGNIFSSSISKQRILQSHKLLWSEGFVFDHIFFGTTLAIEMGALLEDIAHTIHAHPTMTEMTHEAVLATLGHAIHSM